MLKGHGHIVVQPKRGRMVVQLGADFIQYYIWHIQKYFKIRVGSPRDGGHISLALPDFDKNVDWKCANLYKDLEVDFEYDPYIIVGGKTKTFRNFYVNVYSDELERICKDVGTEKKTNSFHITLGNTKGIGFVDYWPQMIELR